MHHIGTWFMGGFLGFGSLFGFFHHFPGYQPIPTPPSGVICAADAMQCPDGTWVGRSGPHCQFVCPTATSTPATQTVTKTGDIVCLPFKGDGPHIMICTYGLHDDDNSYYALKNAWNNGVPSFEVGDHVQVKGTFTAASATETYNIKGTIDVKSITKLNVQPQKQTVSVKIGQSVSALDVTITPTAVLEDSRCPMGVMCIWAGQVRVQTTLVSGMGMSNPIFVLGSPITTEAETITLVGVTPPKTQGQNNFAPSDYTFTFEIAKR